MTEEPKKQSTGASQGDSQGLSLTVEWPETGHLLPQSAPLQKLWSSAQNKSPAMPTDSFPLQLIV